MEDKKLNSTYQLISPKLHSKERDNLSNILNFKTC